jgi:Asp-tRNA(Asn)/Glu-tRNA(Gln) amidotransferase B subunit
MSTSTNSDIHKTNVEKIKQDIAELIKELKETDYIYTKTPGDTMFESLQNKYNYLYKTSKTLFAFIVQEANKTNFSKENFDKKINEILNLILKIQKSELTQNEASEKVGVMLANEYIPAHLLK